MLRPETLTFLVESEQSITRCDQGRSLVPIRELFTTLAPGEKSGVSVLLSTFCPDHTFDRAGLYAVHFSLDTTHASGASIGFRTFDGHVAGASPVLLRIRHSNRRISTDLLPRPAVD
jgi:hypothetical protein